MHALNLRSHNVQCKYWHNSCNPNGAINLISWAISTIIIIHVRTISVERLIFVPEDLMVEMCCNHSVRTAVLNEASFHMERSKNL